MLVVLAVAQVQLLLLQRQRRAEQWAERKQVVLPSIVPVEVQTAPDKALVPSVIRVAEAVVVEPQHQPMVVVEVAQVTTVHCQLPGPMEQVPLLMALQVLAEPSTQPTVGVAEVAVLARLVQVEQAAQAVLDTSF
jgi:hypothetical protein